MSMRRAGMRLAKKPFEIFELSDARVNFITVIWALTFLSMTTTVVVKSSGCHRLE